MTASKIRTDYESLIQIAGVFQYEAEKSRQMVQGIRSQVEVLQNGDWLGKGSEVFYREMSATVLPALGRLTTALESAAQTTGQINQVMQQAEADAARVLRDEDGSSGSREPGAAGGSSSAFRSKKLKEDRAALFNLVDQPHLAHQQWEKLSLLARARILLAMRKKYGEDWVDEFVTRQKSDSIGTENFSYGSLAPGVEELEFRGFALAYALPLFEGESRFERWVHPDGSWAQMVRGFKTEPPRPPPADPFDEEDPIIDMPYDEFKRLCDQSGFIFNIDEDDFEQSQFIPGRDGKFSIKVRTKDSRITLLCDEEDQCSPIISPLELEE